MKPTVSDNPWLEAATAWTIARQYLMEDDTVSPFLERVRDMDWAIEQCKAKAGEQAILDALPMFTQVRYAGRVDLRNPTDDTVDIRDIAFGLSRRLRFNGVSDITVGVHSLIAAQLCERRGGSPRQQMEHLLHDAPETYLSDFIRPMKRQFPLYNQLEAMWERYIFNRWVGPNYVGNYAEIDNYLLQVEIAHQFSKSPMGFTTTPVVDEDLFACMNSFLLDSPRTVEQEFLTTFHMLEDQIAAGT